MSTPWPQIPRAVTLRHSLQMARDPIGNLNRLHAAHGDTVRLHLGGVVAAVSTRDPALAQHILQKNHRRYAKSDLTHGLIRYLGRGLLTNEGADWLRQRRLIQPGFHRQRLGGLTRLMAGVVNEWLDGLAAQAGPSGLLVLEVHLATTHLAFEVMARSIFGGSLDARQLQQLSSWLEAIQAFYVATIRQPYWRPWLWLRGQYGHHDQLAQRLRQLILAAVARHRAATGAGAPPSDDLLQMLLETRYEDTGQGMSDEQLLDELNILLVAGHETSANALAWACYLLARHPATQQRLLAEAEAVLAPGQAPEFAELPRLPYALQVVHEAMRLYPPAWIVDRVATEADEFEGQPIAAGTLFNIYLYGLHHHPALWPDAEAFRPERFAPGATPAPPAYGYLPFGGGPRLCVGSQFALTELQLALVQLVRRFRLELAEEAVPSMTPLITLRPGQPLRLRLTRR